MSHVRTRSLIALAGLLGCGALGAWAADAAKAPEAKFPPPLPEAMKRWQDMRFGMFIHWGPVTLTGHEIGWSRGLQTPIPEYDALYKRFEAKKFDADAWARVARDAGAKYVVLTTKHHDGFCLWDTQLTDFNIMNSPLRRDVVKELAAACKKHGLAFGTYYSTCDWHHPDFPLTSPGGKVARATHNLDRYNEYLLGQIRELITRYGPLITLWNDVPQKFQGRGARTITMVRELQPDILVNNRTGDGGDYETPEQRVGAFNLKPWETCMTLCRQWSWKPNDEMKSLEQCVQTLVRCAGGNGNLLFNVAPDADGEIEPRQVERMREIGAWLKQNGEAIYATRGGPYKPTRSYAATRRGHTIFLHVLNWPEGALTLPPLPQKITRASLLSGEPVAFETSAAGLTLRVPVEKRQPIDTIVRLELAGSAMDLEPIASAPVMRARASHVYGNNPQYAADMAVDGDAQSRWATPAGTRQAWIEIDLLRPTRIGQVHVVEAVAERVQRFEMTYKDGETWKPLLQGGKLGRHFTRTFPPVTTRFVRLAILDASDGPTISEIDFAEK